MRWDLLCRTYPFNWIKLVTAKFRKKSLGTTFLNSFHSSLKCCSPEEPKLNWPYTDHVPFCVLSHEPLRQPYLQRATITKVLNRECKFVKEMGASTGSSGRGKLRKKSWFLRQLTVSITLFHSVPSSSLQNEPIL